MEKSFEVPQIRCSCGSSRIKVLENGLNVKGDLYVHMLECCDCGYKQPAFTKLIYVENDGPFTEVISQGGE